MRWLWYTFLALFSLGMLGLIGVVGGAVGVISYYGRDLPDYRALKDYEPPVVTRIYAGDGRLLEEYAQERRVFVPIESIPDVVKYAFISAEDKNYFSHNGIDYLAIMRAMATNVRNFGSGRRPVGASTITQQVAKNLWLSGERTIARKLQEAYLTWRLEAVHTKRRIIEIYLNLASWGPGTRGIRAASKRYFGAEPAELATVEVALLAAILPNPARFGAWIEQGKLATSRLEKVEHTLRNLRFMKKIDAAEYDRAWQLARDQGRIGRLTLVLCDDDGSAGAGVETCAPE